MTRRILLALAEDTTETGCGGCLARDHRWCGAFAGRLNYRSESDDTILRRGECLAAERQAARMVEIDPEDAQYTAGMLRLLASDEERRVKIALSAHGRKVVPHG